MKLNLSSLEKKAVTKVLFDIMRADGRLTVGETKYFLQLQDTLGITKIEMDESNNLSAINCLNILKDLSTDQKGALAVMMVEMVRADGDIADEEIKVFAIVAAVTGIPLP